MCCRFIWHGQTVNPRDTLSSNKTLEAQLPKQQSWNNIANKPAGLLKYLSTGYNESHQHFMSENYTIKSESRKKLSPRWSHSPCKHVTFAQYLDGMTEILKWPLNICTIWWIEDALIFSPKIWSRRGTLTSNFCCVPSLPVLQFADLL